MSTRWWMHLAGGLGVLGLAACGDPDPDTTPMPDLGNGIDMSTPVDMGVDPLDMAPGEDTGPSTEPDLGPDSGPIVDAGPDATMAVSCNGPPGLYAPGQCVELASPMIRRYHPTYVLWSDGADKERFLYLPPSTQIDTSNPNNWVFPMGTKIWKTFSHSGLRIETRLLEKTDTAAGPGSWAMRTWAWNREQNAVTEVMSGVENALGTSHDIPAAPADCVQCHRGRISDTPLSVSAIQLNHVSTDLNLATLASENRLSSVRPSEIRDAMLNWVVPGTPADKNALGYLHANCGNCHGGTEADGFAGGMRLWVDVNLSGIMQTATWRTAVDVNTNWIPPAMSPPVTARIEPGSPESSAIFRRMGMRDSPLRIHQMPPLATEMIHREGRMIISDWIAALPH